MIRASSQLLCRTFSPQSRDLIAPVRPVGHQAAYSAIVYANVPKRQESKLRSELTVPKVSSNSLSTLNIGASPQPVATKPRSEPEPKQKKLGPELLEGVAACWQNKKNKTFWRCDGPSQDTILGDDTLEMQLGFSGCPNPRAEEGTRTIKGSVTAKIFLCGYGLEGGNDRDIAKKYGFTVQRNKYQCASGQMNKCRDNFQLVR